MSVIGQQEGLVSTEHVSLSGEDLHEFVTFLVGPQWFGVPVRRVQEVLTAQRITPVPLAPPEVGGLLNLRGQIVSAVDMRSRMGLAKRDQDAEEMNIVVEDGGELFSLQVDEVGDVVGVAADKWEPPPATLDDRWRRFCTGVYRLDTSLLVEIDVASLLEIGR